MLRVLLGTVEALLIVLISYNLVVAVFGWRNPKAIPVGARQHHLRVVIPAHDEERVVGGLLDDLVAQDYPGDQHEVWVVADRCNDRTADVALERGARVAEREEGLEGKGPALAWYLDENPLEPGEAIVVLDADNRVSSDLLSRLADVLDQGHQAIQTYLDVANPDASTGGHRGGLELLGLQPHGPARSSQPWLACRPGRYRHVPYSRGSGCGRRLRQRRR